MDYKGGKERRKLDYEGEAEYRDEDERGKTKYYGKEEVECHGRGEGEIERHGSGRGEAERHGGEGDKEEWRYSKFVRLISATQDARKHKQYWVFYNINIKY